MERSLSCSRCGIDVPVTTTYCPGCGLRQEGPTEPDLHPVQRNEASITTLSRNAIEHRSTRKVQAVKRKAKPKG